MMMMSGDVAAVEVRPRKTVPSERTIVLTLAFASASSALFQTVVTPYVAFFIVDTGVASDLASPGYYAAYLTSAEHVGRALTSYGWGRFSDARGRAVVMEVALASIALSSLILSWTLDLRVAIVARFVCGCFDATWSMCKAYAGSQLPRASQPSAMASLGASYGLAMLVGPAIGGLLARPAVEYPSLRLTQDNLLARRPYLLPNLVAALVALAGLAATRLKLRAEERLPAASSRMTTVSRGRQKRKISTMTTTLTTAESSSSSQSSESTGWLAGLLSRRRRPRPRPRRNAGRSSRQGEYAPIVAAARDDDEDDEDDDDTWSSLCARKTGLATAFYSLISIVEFSEDLVFPLWAAAPRAVGGLDLSASNIGAILAVAGACIVPGQLLLYAPLERRLGPVWIVRYGAAIEAPLSAVMPLAAYLRRAGPAPGTACYAWLGLTKVFRVFVAEFVFTSNGIVSNNAVPDNRRGGYLGVHGAISAVGRILGPLLASPLFAWSVQGGHRFPLNFWCAFILITTELVAALVVAVAMPLSLAHPIEEADDDVEHDSDHADDARGGALPPSELLEEPPPSAASASSSAAAHGVLVSSSYHADDFASPGSLASPDRGSPRASLSWEEVPKLKRSRSPHPLYVSGGDDAESSAPPAVVQLVSTSKDSTSV